MIYPIGGHDAEYADAFLGDLAGRLTKRVRLTKDGHTEHLEAVEGAFGTGMDGAMLVKLYDSRSGGTTGR